MAPVIALWLALLGSQAAPPANSPAEQTAASNPDAPRLEIIGGSVTPPTITSQIEPQYTKDAKKKRITGVSVVNLVVDAEGNPVKVRIYRSIVDSLDQKHRDKKDVAAALTLDQAAVDAVEKYKFSPATLHDKPVPVELNIEAHFKIW